MKKLRLIATISGCFIVASAIAAPKAITPSTYEIAVTNGAASAFFPQIPDPNASVYVQFIPLPQSTHYTASCSPIACTNTNSKLNPVFKTNSPVPRGHSEVFTITTTQGPSFQPSLTEMFTYGANVYSPKQSNGLYYYTGFMIGGGQAPIPSGTKTLITSASSAGYQGTGDSSNPPSSNGQMMGKK